MSILLTFPGTARAQEEYLTSAEVPDTLARDTEWTPMRRGGSNIRSHRLQGDGFNRLEFKATLFYKGVAVFFALIGSFPIAFATSSRHKPDWPVILILALICIFAISLSIYMLWQGAAPIVFDKTLGMFWTGRKHPRQVTHMNELESASKLKEIHAVQLLPEWVPVKHTGYYSYEINLVLKDGSRLHVMDHGSQKDGRNDAQIIAGFLEVPCWERILPS